MKLTIQGGARSEVGKKTEKGLLYVIFRLLKVPEDDYVLIFDERRIKDYQEIERMDKMIDAKPNSIRGFNHISTY
jgi:hypothetical protein